MRFCRQAAALPLVHCRSVVAQQLLVYKGIASSERFAGKFYAHVSLEF